MAFIVKFEYGQISQIFALVRNNQGVAWIDHDYRPTVYLAVNCTYSLYACIYALSFSIGSSDDEGNWCSNVFRVFSSYSERT